MKTEIDYEAIENATSKITTGFRCDPELKLQLADEATELGISLSEHLENILCNRNAFAIEKAQLKGEVEKHKMDKEVQSNEISKLKNELETQKKEIEQLNIKVKGATTVSGFLSHPFLLNLFNRLKGQKDTIDGFDGKKYSFQYNSPSDLLLAMIYSFKLKK